MRCKEDDRKKPYNIGTTEFFLHNLKVNSMEKFTKQKSIQMFRKCKK